MSGEKWREKMGKDGRHTVYSTRTGKLYLVEPIKPNVTYRAVWGDIDPATNKTTGSYGVKNNGAIIEAESIINEENGFTNISTSKGSPYTAIQKIDSLYPTV